MPTEAEAPADLATVLCRLSDTYGRSICREPQRVAAMLLDICPDRRRESFLLVSALREHVVTDLMGGLDVVPEAVLIARGVHKLRDNLGLAEDSARWAVESWLPAARILSTAPERPMRMASEEREPVASVVETPPAESRRPPVDWPWLGLCAGALVCAAAAIVTVARFALFHYWVSLQGWATETALLAAPLAACAIGVSAIAAALAKRTAPDHRLLDPNRAAFALLVEVTVLLALPLVPVVSVAMWAMEWVRANHLTGQPHDLTFHLGRMLQSLLLGLFLYLWLPRMTKIQGCLASSMVRRR